MLRLFLWVLDLLLLIKKNLDDVDNYREMKKLIKPYKENEDYFSFKLSELSNGGIGQLSLAQNEFDNTWGNFVEFMEIIDVKEKSEVKYVEIKNENDKNNEIKKSDDNKDNNTDEPEENLGIVMRYLKNHLPMIFKFINAICNFFY